MTIEWEHLHIAPYIALCRSRNAARRVNAVLFSAADVHVS